MSAINNEQSKRKIHSAFELLRYCVLLILALLLVACGEQISEITEYVEYQAANKPVESDSISESNYEQNTEITLDNMPENYLIEPEPMLLPSPMPHRNIAAGTFHSLAIIDGSIWAWGFNWHGQLGDGTNENRATPVQIGTDTNWISVCVGWSHTVALKADGSLWAWGNNEFGNLGDGTTENKANPIQVGYDTNWVSVVTGDYHTMAIKADGTLWGWGLNSHNQVIDSRVIESGELSIVSEPMQIGNDTGWVRVMPSWRHTLALRYDGSLWFWGYDTANISRRNRAPTRIGTYEDWLEMMVPGRWSTNFEIREDGSLWAWGYNWAGQLGDGTTTNRDSPVQIGTSTDWIDVALGDKRTVGIKTDGSVWSWGWVGLVNHDIEVIEVFSLIGDGGDEDRHSPVKIISGMDVEE